MRFLIIMLTILFSNFELVAQYQQLNQAESSIQVKIDLLENEIAVNPNIKISAPYLQELNISLNRGDIIIDYSLRKGDDKENYIISMEANIDGQNISIYPEDLIGNLGSEISAKANSNQQIIWTTLLDRYINLKGSLTIILKTELWGTPKLPFGIECGNPPVFKKLPHYVAAGLGIASLGASVIFNNKSNTTYDSDYLSQNFEELAEPFYQRANDDHQKSLILRYAGSAILAIDAVWYIYRSIRHSKKEEAYRENCADYSKIKLKPLIEFPVAYTNPGQLGFSVIYQFGK